MNQSAEALIRVIESRNRFSLQYGVITFKHAAEVDIRLAGSSTSITNAKYLAWYNPTVDDVVACLVNKNDVLVLGKIHKA